MKLWYFFGINYNIHIVRASLKAQLVKNLLACRRPWFSSWFRKISWRRDRLPTPVFLGFPCGSAGKESACNVGDLGAIPGLGRPPGEGKGHPLQYFGLENSMDCVVHRVTKSWIWLSDFHIVIPYLLCLPGLVSYVVRIKVCRRCGFSCSWPHSLMEGLEE